MDHTNLSPTDVFSGHHDYELFIQQIEIDAPNGNLNHQDTHNCENQDDILIHATILSHTFALPQLMAQHNCEYLDPTDDPSTVPTVIQATSDHTFNPRCAHNPIATQCNQSQYLNHNHNFALSQVMNPTVNTWNPLILQVQYQPLSKPPVITPSILNLLIT